MIIRGIMYIGSKSSGVSTYRVQVKETNIVYALLSMGKLCLPHKNKPKSIYLLVIHTQFQWQFLNEEQKKKNNSE
jgi:hypothetical protein